MILGSINSIEHYTEFFSMIIAFPQQTTRPMMRLVMATALMAVAMFYGIAASAHERPDSLANLSKALSPAVVNISTTMLVDGIRGTFDEVVNHNKSVVTQ